MPVLLVENRLLKVACNSCIKGHRSKSCKHWDRVLVEVRKPGRPQSECQHTSTECKCLTRAAYYVPGHQPRFAPAAAPRTTDKDKDNSPVVVNALEHSRPVTKREPSTEATPSGPGTNGDLNGSSKRPHDLEASTAEGEQPSISNVASSVRKPNDLDSPATSAKAHVKKPAAEATSDSAKDVTKACCSCSHHSTDDPKSPAESSSLQNASTQSKPRTETSTFEHNPKLTSTQPSHQYQNQYLPPYSTSTVSGGCCAVPQTHPGFPSIPTPEQQFPHSNQRHHHHHSHQPTQNFYNQNPMPSTAFPSVGITYAQFDPTWTAFPVSDAFPGSGQDQCSCTDEAHCLCMGCLDHPANPATMGLVYDTLEFQAFDTFANGNVLEGDVGDALLPQNNFNGSSLLPDLNFASINQPFGQASDHHFRPYAP